MTTTIVKQAVVVWNSVYLLWLRNRMPVTQLDIRLCNQVPQCITYIEAQLPGCAIWRSESYPVVQPDSLKSTRLYNWMVWKLPGCTTGQAESFWLSKQMVWSYLKLQHDSLKAIWWCNWTCSSLAIILNFAEQTEILVLFIKRGGRTDVCLFCIFTAAK